MNLNSLFKERRFSLCILFAILFCFSGCEPEEEINPVVQAHQWFEKNLGSQWTAWPKNSKIQSIEWENAITYGKITEVPVIFESNVVGHYYNGEESAKGKISMRLVLWPEDKSYKAAVIELVHQGGDLPQNLTDIHSSGFNGLLLANFGDGEKYATIFKNGNKDTGTETEKNATRTEAQYCLYFIYEHTVRSGSYTHTWIEWELQYCYDETEWQIPLPPEGGGWALDYTGSGGGGGAQWNPGFPSAPQSGDTYEVREPSGKSTTYRYNANAQAWEVSEVILPAIEITPQTYPFLMNIPTDFPVLGADGFLYLFDQNLMSWVARPIVDNQTITPCIYNQIEAIRNANLQTEIQEIFSRVFDNELVPNSYTFIESVNIDRPARTEVTNFNPLQITTTLNTSILANASNEYNTIVIYHEIIHSILYHQGLIASLHHSDILENYVDELVQIGQFFFPSVPLQDFQALALLGLRDISNTQAYLDLMDEFELTTENISETGLSYRRDEVEGSTKKGTPCN